MTIELLHKLVKSAGYHREPLRVTSEFYSEVQRMPPSSLHIRPALPPIGTEVIVVTDGSENVKWIAGAWTFVPDARNA